MISYPCVPCLPGTCSDYACDSSCPGGGDPYTFTVTFSNLDLSPKPVNSTAVLNQTQLAGDGSGSGSSGSGGFSSGASGSGASASGELNGATSDLITEPLSSTVSVTYSLEASLYFITIEAVTASGQYIHSSSNGVLIDLTPPVLVSPIEQFDVAHSATQASLFQGNNHTVSARWLFRDLDSGIVEYQWAIGTAPYAQDIQSFVSVGKMTQATNSKLEGLLMHNVTYFITVQATNGAGLTGNATSLGITYLDIELNATQLEMAIYVEHTEALLIPGENGTAITVFKTTMENRVSVSWEGVSEDVSQICKLSDDISDTHFLLFIGVILQPPFFYIFIISYSFSFLPIFLWSPLFYTSIFTFINYLPLLPFVLYSLVWYIGSEPTNSEDIFPRTDVSFNNGRSAAIDFGILYIDSSPLGNVSDIIALNDGVDPQSVSGLLFEPGRPFYHTLELCNLAHSCVISQPRAAIFISTPTLVYAA